MHSEIEAEMDILPKQHLLSSSFKSPLCVLKPAADLKSFVLESGVLF